MRLHKKIAKLFGYELIRIKTKQPTVESQLKDLFSKLRINCVIDVGANLGQYGTMLRENGYKGNIFSFEPVSSSFEILSEKCKNDKKWTVFRYALGSKEELKSINVAQSSHFSSFHNPNDYSKNQFEVDTVLENTEKVEVKKLDSIFNELLNGIDKPNVFLKMDTQGFDLEVFKGAEKSINKIVGLQSEISLIPIYEGMPDYLESLTLFKSKDFHITGLYPVSREKNTFRLIELDCLMRKDS